MIIRSLSIAIYLGMGVVAAPAQDRLELVSGRVELVSDVRLGPDWELAITQAGRRQTVTQWYAWGAFRPRASGTHVLLTDGSHLRGDVLALAEEAVVVDCRALGRVQIPPRYVRAIVVHPPRGWLARDALWDRIYAATSSQQDTVWLANGDRVTGTVLLDELLPERLPLMLATIRLQLATTGDTVELPRRRVAAIRFAVRPSMALLESAAMGIVAWDDGTCLRAASAELSHETRRVTLGCGWKWRGTGEVREARLAYLRSPARYWRAIAQWQVTDPVHVPMWNRAVSPRFDRNVLGGRLRVGGKEYYSGIGALGRSRLVFDVPDNAASLATMVGVDQSAGPRGSVRFRIYGQQDDGEWVLLTESDRLGVEDPPQRLAISMVGIRRVALITDAADRGETEDYADWLDARFSFPAGAAQ